MDCMAEGRGQRAEGSVGDGAGRAGISGLVIAEVEGFSAVEQVELV